MVTEGQFPKIDGDIFYAEDTSLMNKNPFIAYPSALGKGYATRVYVDTFTADNADTKTNLTYHAQENEYQATNAAITFESMGYMIPNNITKIFPHIEYDIYNVIDECGDGAVNGAIWTSVGAVAENASSLNVGGANAVNSATTIDLSTYDMVEVYIRLKGEHRPIGGFADTHGTAYLIVTDGGGGTNTVFYAMGTGSDGAAVPHSNEQEIIGLVTFFINWADKKCLVNWSITNDIKGTNTNYVSINARHYHETDSKYINLAGWGSFKIQFKTTDSAANPTGAVSQCFYLRKYNFNPTSTVTTSLSIDGGGSYSTVDNDGPFMCGVAGNELKLKLTGNIAANEVISIRSCKFRLIE